MRVSRYQLRQIIREAATSGPYTKFEPGDPVMHIEKPEKGLGLIIACDWDGRNLCVKWRDGMSKHTPYVLKKKEFDRKIQAALKRKAVQYEKFVGAI